MKSFKDFLSESITISDNASVGSIIINNGSSEQETYSEEQFSAEVFWDGNLYTMFFELDQKGLPSRTELSNRLQEEYPGAIVNAIYPNTPKSSSVKVKEMKRFNVLKQIWENNGSVE